MRMNGSIQAEGAFGVLKQDYGFRRSLCRSKPKTIIQVDPTTKLTKLTKADTKVSTI
ncbi:hypothetical protein CUS_5981 [Ruminococcus albus 8]|uniref:Transposase DDE domain-containing protein n=1 Tax=Ruminococcus albus 8 TaxID=246199 RepID=E9SEF1_RUMAL|nr:hypothetical protein CUS_5981 [Ruminococcus albus 8]